RPQWAPLLEGNPFVDRVIVADRGPGAMLTVIRNLRQERFDVVVDFQALLQSAVVTAAVRCQKKVGLHRSQARERLASLVYSTAVLTRSDHRVERNLELAAAAGATNLLRVFPAPEGRPEGDLPDGAFVLASPLAGWGAKQWPMEYYTDLARALEIPLVLNGPPSAEETLRRVRGVRVHISGVAGLIDATRRASAVVGVDSGPLHLAAALSKPGVGIYGPTNPAVHGPYGGSMRVLRASGAVTTLKRRDAEDANMRAVTPPVVFAELQAALRCPVKTTAGSPA
ncbi:MAG: glycosyltransferase family 9 protein, partial [Bryobacterales bacterium]|nr:glycosyltransferase family 9 protein [Bryobacterales bacterium]